MARTTWLLPIPPLPAAHDPRGRVLLTNLPGDWEVRALDTRDRRFGYCMQRGLWHVQLWQPGARCSVLTPSRFTLGRYDVFHAPSWNRALPDETAVEQALSDRGAPLVGALLAEVWERFVRDVEQAWRRGEHVACA
ncbi:MAG: hypothetical protein IPJ34_40440 [Myxococcales bacterium]|nr:hypothetical protein [Myxococcales bacterium]